MSMDNDFPNWTEHSSPVVSITSYGAIRHEVTNVPSREECALRIMIALISNNDRNLHAVAAYAVEAANLLLKELDKTKK